MASSILSSRLGELLVQIAMHEQEVENARRNLFPVFSPQIAYALIDHSRKGYISSWDLIRFMKGRDSFCNEQMALAIVKQYDSQHNIQIDYPGFLALFTPAHTAQPMSNTAESREMEGLMVSVMLKEMSFHHRVEGHRRTLKETAGYNLVDLFQMAAEGQTCTKESISRFLNGDGFRFDAEDIEAIFRRMNKCRSGAISFTEFCDTVIVTERGLGSVEELRTGSPAKKILRTSSPLRSSGSPKRASYLAPTVEPERLIQPAAATQPPTVQHQDFGVNPRTTDFSVTKSSTLRRKPSAGTYEGVEQAADVTKSAQISRRSSPLRYVPSYTARTSPQRLVSSKTSFLEQTQREPGLDPLPSASPTLTRGRQRSPLRRSSRSNSPAALQSGRRPSSSRSPMKSSQSPQRRERERDGDVMGSGRKPSSPLRTVPEGRAMPSPLRRSTSGSPTRNSPIPNRTAPLRLKSQSPERQQPPPAQPPLPRALEGSHIFNRSQIHPTISPFSPSKFQTPKNRDNSPFLARFKNEISPLSISMVSQENSKLNSSITPSFKEESHRHN